MAKIDIKIVSDMICPWCYVGKKRLERAIDVYKKVSPGGSDDVFAVSWHPFYLDPSLPAVGVDRAAHLAKKFGADRVEAIQARLRSIGEAEGIRFGGGGKIGNTRDAHRLVQLAKTKPDGSRVENELVGQLFRWHFEEGGDVTSHKELADAAAKVPGLDKAEVEKWLSDGSGGDEVDREVQEAYAAGVHGVPNFTINGKYEVSGAQDVEAFLEVFSKARELAPAVGAGSKEGVSC